MGDRYQPIVTYAGRPTHRQVGRSLGQSIRANSKGLASTAGATSIALAAYAVLYSGMPPVVSGRANVEGGVRDGAIERTGTRRTPPIANRSSASAFKDQVTLNRVGFPGTIGPVPQGARSATLPVKSPGIDPPLPGIDPPLNDAGSGSELLTYSALPKQNPGQMIVPPPAADSRAAGKIEQLAIGAPPSQLVADQGSRLPSNTNRLSNDTLAGNLSVPSSFLLAGSPSDDGSDKSLVDLAGKQVTVEAPGSDLETTGSIQSAVIAEAMDSSAIERASATDIPPTALIDADENQSATVDRGRSSEMRSKTNDVSRLRQIRSSLERLDGKSQNPQVDRTPHHRSVERKNDGPRKAEVLAQSGESFGESLELQIHDGELVSVRLSELISLFEDRLDRSLFVWLKTSAAAEKYVTSETLAKAGIRLTYDNTTRQAILSVSDSAAR